MKKLSLFAVIFVLMAFSASSAVNVTFVANTATVPDTLKPDSFVQIRGEPPFTWDAGSVVMTSIAGDYWTATVEIPGETTVHYKFFTHPIDGSGGGWECNTDDISNNRVLTTGTEDIILPLEFVNGLQHGLPQDFRPYAPTDSHDIWFRVNMQCYPDFNPVTQEVGVRGAAWPDSLGDLSWFATHYLTQENVHGNPGQCDYNGTHFWSGRVRIPKEDVNPGDMIEYKFVIMNKGVDPWEDPAVWEGRPNRVFTVPFTGHDDQDTTLHWVWFDDQVCTPIPPHEDTVVVTFDADLSAAINANGFAHGETLEVNVGYYGTASEVTTTQMIKVGFTDHYTATCTVLTTIGEHLDYQYYKIVGGTDYREIYYNFYYDGETTGEAERRVQDPVYANVITVADTLTSEDEIHRMPLFRNTDVVRQDVVVTFECDVRPAVWALYLCCGPLDDIQSTVDVSDPDSVLILGVAMNGPATEYGWSNGAGAPDWGPHLMTYDYKRMWDDGTNGDRVAGDSIYTRIEYYYVDSNDVVGQELKFGVGGGDNEGGYGNNHIENIDDSQPTSTIALQFGSIDPIKFCCWDFNLKKAYQIGDVNKDHTVNILDALAAVWEVLDPCHLPQCQKCLADCNMDGQVNILDVLGIVNLILGIGTCPPAPSGKVVLSADVLDYLESLADYMAPEDYATFMALLKAELGMPTEYRLSQNYPNPFNPETTIEYALPADNKVKLSVYNVLGQQVKVLAEGQMEAGYHTVTFDGSELSSGVYFYRLEAGNHVMTKKMVLMK